MPEHAVAGAPWAATLAKYKLPSRLKSGWQIVNSLVPFCGMWYLMYLSTFWSYWLTLLLAVPTAGFLVRIFIIQHDCGHHSFFRNRHANDVLGHACGFLTLTPYYLWRRSHARHHSSSGDLNHRGQGDVGVLTVEEYRSRTRFGRLKYRLYRNPIVMFVFGASYLFILRQRFTIGIPRGWRRERRDVHYTNLGLAAIVALGWYTIGLPTFLMIHLPIVMLGAAFGSWLFFVQHQFEDAYWQPHQSWDFKRSALEGSSYYRLPRVLQWFTGNIGFHHIHHLSPRIPNYRLEPCHHSDPMFDRVRPMTLWSSFKSLRLRLWDEASRKLVGFAHLRGLRRATSSAIVSGGKSL